MIPGTGEILENFGDLSKEFGNLARKKRAFMKQKEEEWAKKLRQEGYWVYQN